ncbi:EXG1 [Symbiodinium sp. CCMP2592]|nr:EXG1 [Symbiodinium sp. CCMP2592]
MQIRSSTELNASYVSGTPYGTNLGGWLCLEDWFFSGFAGRFVSTSDSIGQGACLPPLLQGGEKPWPSEGVLTHRLAKKYGKKFAAQVFMAHRNDFINPSDLQAMKEIGIKVVRIPVMWTLFADALAVIDKEAYGSHDPDKDTVIVPDPYYTENISYATIPRNLLEWLFIQGHELGLRFLLDIHAFPGGSSDGTYNGIYPERPVFWTEDVQLGKKPRSSLQYAGLLIVDAAIAWIEGLSGAAKKAVYGLSPMNEPAHLAGFQNPTFADHKVVLSWLETATKKFSRSKLVKQDVKMYMQVIETAFPGDTFNEEVPSWWKEVTSVKDRNTWAVFDMHWYTAWGTKAGLLPGDAAVLCSQGIDKILEVLSPGIEGFAESFKENFDGQRATSEFSASTNADALVACADVAITKAFMEKQVEVMKKHGINPYFWSLKMPYGPTFESQWSLKKIYGLQETPRYPCAVGAGVKFPAGDVPCFAGDC